MVAGHDGDLVGSPSHPGRLARVRSEGRGHVGVAGNGTEGLARPGNGRLAGRLSAVGRAASWFALIDAIQTSVPAPPRAARPHDAHRAALRPPATGPAGVELQGQAHDRALRRGSAPATTTPIERDRRCDDGRLPDGRFSSLAGARRSAAIKHGLRYGPPGPRRLRSLRRSAAPGAGPAVFVGDGAAFRTRGQYCARPSGIHRLEIGINGLGHERPSLIVEWMGSAAVGKVASRSSSYRGVIGPPARVRSRTRTCSAYVASIAASRSFSWRTLHPRGPDQEALASARVGQGLVSATWLMPRTSASSRPVMTPPRRAGAQPAAARECGRAPVPAARTVASPWLGARPRGRRRGSRRSMAGSEQYAARLIEDNPMRDTGRATPGPWLDPEEEFWARSALMKVSWAKSQRRRRLGVPEDVGVDLRMVEGEEFLDEGPVVGAFRRGGHARPKYQVVELMDTDPLAARVQAEWHAPARRSPVTPWQLAL